MQPVKERPMLEVRVSREGAVERLFTQGGVENVAVAVTAAVAVIHASLYATNPDAAAQFRETLLMILTPEDSYAWNADAVATHMANTTCVVTQRGAGEAQ